MNYHFETDEVLAATEGTEYLKQNILHHLRTMTSGERWSLYRAVAKLISEKGLSE